MGRTRIVTDSTADLPAGLAEELGITVVPLNVHFGDELLKDGVTITAVEFFDKLAQSDILPRTSQPSPADFADVYRELGADGSPIVSVHISTKLSGTIQSANLGREIIKEGDVRVIDSRVASMGLGMMAVQAARRAAAGWGPDEIVAELEDIRARSLAGFTVATLEYLEKNGRIGKAAALLGSLLKVKPLLILRDGEIHPWEKVRGAGRVVPRFIELILEVIPAGSRVCCSVLHAANPEGAEQVEARLREHWEMVECHRSLVGPVIGCHVGPGLLAVCAYPV